MLLDTIRPAESATHASRCVDHGTGSDLGKTGDRDHKGQKSRAGGFHKVGFEGGQMSLQRRLPKRGFKPSTAAANAEVRLSELNLIAVDEIDILVLKQTGLTPTTASNAKTVASGEISKAVILEDMKAIKDTRVAIEAAGGKVKE